MKEIIIFLTEQSDYQYWKYDRDISYPQQLQRLKSLATWFKKEFPYYYNQCLFCQNNENNES